MFSPHGLPLLPGLILDVFPLKDVSSRT